MTDTLDFKSFVRSPFQVKAVQITPENMDAIAELIGEIKIKNGEKFILINKRIVPAINKAYPGWWVTLLDGNYRCYSPRIFTDQFREVTYEPNTLTTEVSFTFNEDEEGPNTFHNESVHIETEFDPNQGVFSIENVYVTSSDLTYESDPELLDEDAGTPVLLKEE